MTNEVKAAAVPASFAGSRTSFAAPVEFGAVTLDATSSAGFGDAASVASLSLAAGAELRIAAGTGSVLVTGDATFADGSTVAVEGVEGLVASGRVVLLSVEGSVTGEPKFTGLSRGWRVRRDGNVWSLERPGLMLILR